MDPFPLALEYRLRCGDRVVWWGRPVRLAIAGRRDLALLPVIAIAAATAAVVAFAPGPTWHPVVATIFRLAFAASGVSLIATHLTIVARQRRRRFYAVALDRVLLADDFWSGGFRAVPLDRITDAKVDARPPGDGPITLIVDDGTCPQLAHVADAQGVRATLMEARADFLRRMPDSVPLEIVDTLEPDERVLWWGRPTDAGPAEPSRPGRRADTELSAHRRCEGRPRRLCRGRRGRATPGLRRRGGRPAVSAAASRAGRRSAG